MREVFRLITILFLGIVFGLLAAYPTDNAIRLADRTVLIFFVSWTGLTAIVISICITGVKLANSKAVKAIGNG